MTDTPWLYDEWECSPRLRVFITEDLVRGNDVALTLRDAGCVLDAPIAGSTMEGTRLRIYIYSDPAEELEEPESW